MCVKDVYMLSRPVFRKRLGDQGPVLAHTPTPTSVSRDTCDMFVCLFCSWFLLFYLSGWGEALCTEYSHTYLCLGGEMSE